MNITDEIRQDGEILDGKQDDIFYTLMNGKDITEEIETARGKFTVKFPKQKDILAISRRKAALRGGIPANCFDDDANYQLTKLAYLDITVVSGEKWFEAVRKKSNFSWGEIPDGDLVDELFVKAWSFREKVQKYFGRDEEDAHTGSTDGGDVQKTMGDGLFEGASSSAERN